MEQVLGLGSSSAGMGKSLSADPARGPPFKFDEVEKLLSKAARVPVALLVLLDSHAALSHIAPVISPLVSSPQ